MRYQTPVASALVLFLILALIVNSASAQEEDEYQGTREELKKIGAFVKPIADDLWSQFEAQVDGTAAANEEKQKLEQKQEEKENYEKYRKQDARFVDFLNTEIILPRVQKDPDNQDLKFWNAYYIVLSTVYDNESIDKAWGVIQDLAAKGHTGAMCLSAYYLNIDFHEVLKPGINIYPLPIEVPEKNLTKAREYYDRAAAEGNLLAFYYRPISERKYYDLKPINQPTGDLLSRMIESAFIGQNKELTTWNVEREPGNISGRIFGCGYASIGRSTSIFDHPTYQKNPKIQRYDYIGRYNEATGAWEEIVESILDMENEGRSFLKIQKYLSERDWDFLPRIISHLVVASYKASVTPGYQDTTMAGVITELQTAIATYQPETQTQIEKISTKIKKVKITGGEVLPRVTVYKKILADLLSSPANPKPDFDQAFSLYENASKDGDPMASYKLAQWYMDPKKGKQDYAKARLLLSEAKNADAAFDLAELYDYGLGGARDSRLAAFYYTNFFAKRGHKYYYAGKLDHKMSATLDGLKRNDPSRLSDLPIFLLGMSGSDIRAYMDKPGAKLKVVHFFSPSRNATNFASLKATATLVNYITTQGIELHLGSQHGVKSLMPGLLGYKGVFFEILDHPANKKTSFDARWPSDDFPATFVFVEGEKEPTYFGKSVPIETIVKFIDKKRKQLYTVADANPSLAQKGYNISMKELFYLPRTTESYFKIDTSRVLFNGTIANQKWSGYPTRPFLYRDSVFHIQFVGNIPEQEFTVSIKARATSAGIIKPEDFSIAMEFDLNSIPMFLSDRSNVTMEITKWQQVSPRIIRISGKVSGLLVRQYDNARVQIQHGEFNEVELRVW